MIEGVAQPLTQNENEQYWKSMPYKRQLRFTAYAPTSGQVMNSISQLENEYNRLNSLYSEGEIPMSQFYLGFRVSSKVIYFYTLGTTSFSEVIRASKKEDIWMEDILSP